MVWRGRPKKRRSLLSRPRTIIGFPPFARFLLFSDSSSAPKSAGLDPSSPTHSSKSQSQASDDDFPRPKPRKLIESNQLSEDDEDFEVEEEEEEQQEIVQADFAFFDPKRDDFTGVKLLLHTYLDNKEWDLSGFVDLILEQTTVGTVVKLKGHEEEDAGHGEEDDDDDAGPFAKNHAKQHKRKLDDPVIYL